MLMSGIFSGTKGKIFRSELEGGRFPMHMHDSWEILLFLDGTGRTWINGQYYPFSPGTILCIPPYFEHQNIPDVYFEDFCLGIRDYLIPGNEVGVFHDDDQKTFLGLIQLYDRFFQAKPLNYGNILKSIEQVMQHLLISWQERRPSRELLALAETMRENVSNTGFQVSSAIAEIPWNANYVRKRFREVYGMSPVAYMNQLRMDEARKYLLTMDLPIGELASLCGISDAKYFTRLFHNATGHSPQEYRRLYRTQQCKKGSCSPDGE